MVSDLEVDLLFMFLQVSLVRELRPTNTASVVCHDWNELAVSSVNSVDPPAPARAVAIVPGGLPPNKASFPREYFFPSRSSASGMSDRPSDLNGVKFQLQ